MYLTAVKYIYKKNILMVYLSICKLISPLTCSPALGNKSATVTSSGNFRIPFLCENQTSVESADSRVGLIVV